MAAQLRERTKGLAEKLECGHERGLTHKQLFLTNDDLKPGMLPTPFASSPLFALRGLHAQLHAVLHDRGYPRKQALGDAGYKTTCHTSVGMRGSCMIQNLGSCLLMRMIPQRSGTGKTTMGSMELCGVLDCGFVQHQHMDDFIINDCGGLVMVAVMALRVVSSRKAKHIGRMFLTMHDWF